jgi:hypothetical protein
MTATPAPSTDRSDFRHVLLSGTKVGALTAAGVVLYLLASAFLPAGAARVTAQTIVVLATATAAGLLPGRWVSARSAEGVAGAAATGLWGTVVFMAIDIVVLRPVQAYPWTWDAIGGGSSWWYLPIWWMLGTFVAWMGGLYAASRREADNLVAAAAPVVAGAVVIAAVAAVAGCPWPFPVNAGAGFVATLTALALVAVARKA